MRQARSLCFLIVTTIVCLLSVEASAQADFQVTLTPQGTASWGILSAADVSSSTAYAGPFPSDNPVIKLQVGRRYRFVNRDPFLHIFQLIAKAPGSDDDLVLLSAVPVAPPGRFEQDFQVNWVSEGGGTTVTFTLTSLLYNAMFDNSAGIARTPGYRCGIHPMTMRGDFNAAVGTHITDPIPPIRKGNFRVALSPFVEGMTAPLSVVQPDDGTDRFLIHDQVGTVVLIANGVRQVQPYLDVSARLVPLGISGPGSYDERGLLGLALHPNFAKHPKVYTYTSEPATGKADFTTTLTQGGVFDHQDVLAEWTVDSANPNRINPASRRELFRSDHPQFNHNGGAMHFGPDGFLYLGIGDGGNANDVGNGHRPMGNAQSLITIMGKMLRIDVDTTNSLNHKYGIPADNPFVNTIGLDEIYAYGLRNPYSFSFDGNRLILGDVGQNTIEEIDIITKGGNYGWHVKEGSFFFDPSLDGFVTTSPVTTVPANLIDPIAEYDHGDGVAVVGGFVYHGSILPEMRGIYVFADLSGRLFYLDGFNKPTEMTVGDGSPLGLAIKGFGQDRNGEIYVCVAPQSVIGTPGAGSVMKLVRGPADVGPSWTRY